jgi:hypothetical protein
MLNCKDILVIIVYSYVMMNVLKSTDTQTKVLVTAAAVLLIFYDSEGFLNYKMSSLDGLNLQTLPNTNTEIEKKLSPYYGSSYVSLRDHEAVDQDDKMFVWKSNHSDLRCCPATYSTDRGCVCSTAEQENLGRQRFGNNTPPSSV